jgi:hypothetical protein
MTPLWIALILIPAGALMLFSVIKSAWPKPPEVDEDDIWDEPSEEDFAEDAEPKEIVDISEGDGRPAPSRPPITMTSRGIPKKPAALPARAGSKVANSKVAKSEPASRDRMTVENLKKISPTKPAVESGPTVAANGEPIKPKRR